MRARMWSQAPAIENIHPTAEQIERLGRKTLRIVSNVCERDSLQELHD